MEKLTYYWKKLRQNKLAYNFVLIAAIILAMAVTAHFVMQVGTRHGARRIVPDFSGVKLDDAQRTAIARMIAAISTKLYASLFCRSFFQ